MRIWLRRARAYSVFAPLLNKKEGRLKKLVAPALAGLVLACAPNSFTETIAPTLVPPADLAKYRCKQLGLDEDKDCLLKQYEQIIAARAEERKAAGATRTSTNVSVNTDK